MTSVLAYPTKDSPMDIWLLPSGKSVAEVTCGPSTLHKPHPSYIGIILGSRIQWPKWIENEDWIYLQESIEYPKDPLGSDMEKLFNNLLETPEDNKPLGLKIDGVFQTVNDNPLEIGMIELSGRYNTHDFPQYLKDHVHGCWGQHDLLNNIAMMLLYGNYKNMRHLRTWFFHTHGKDVQIWGMDLPRGLNDSVNVLEELKKTHHRNSLLHSQASALKRYIRHIKHSLKNPLAKSM
ncbi:19414_t:CDS:2 [Entrophospora sp. SA101]|nr:7411_t:CDS:2 [Entrophospora sp. SA101]CAJ0767519.1 19414_t:CDS:2 [Entrophospora sp. SA101]